MASNISSQGARAIHSAATSSMPFLYQTRTLCSSRKPMRQPALRLMLCRPSRSQLFHSYASSCIRVSRTLWSDKEDPDTATPSNTQAPISEDRPLIRRYIVDRKSNKVEEEEDLPWDSPSFGRSTDKVTTDPVSEADDIQFDMATFYDPFAEEEDMFSEYEGEPDFTIPSSRRPGESTITLEERDTFQRIFSDIYARSQSTRPQEQSLVDLSEVNKENAREKLHSIMEEAVRLPQNTLFTSQPREKNLDTLKQYPIALRAVAARALGLEGKPSRTSERPQEKPVDKYKEFRQQEQERVEAAMRAAPTDIALWAIMEKEVFSLIPRLGLEERKAPAAPRPKKKGGKSSKKAVETAAGKLTGVTPAPEPLDINLYFPLYASYLLYGLRLLHHSFAKHSPLACNVLPRIKSLGLVSHVLGGTTALYNELLRIYWFQYDDFSGVIRLLEEMEESGLELDEETLDVVTDIQQMQARYLFSREQKAQRTPIHLLWTMNEFAPGRFKSWQIRIRDTLEREE
ncbi:hypothetical protein VC83_04532 [Pseudogymnoascus destructans]|uniref:Mtf2-like C-terminal domain-containing protein n=2 Tax=Pseudogymnoascus destructans TaxID=655981 RepID=L8G4N0_PSED2|nr:uncharacterized protein VC83_04532 [Pseudogymnoascus destructans]ELR08235.1 hypothetical protein GMDG_03037 [Pseudogymnoascus destructans 20631-21]OAF57533.1 hypothetical protein VC83_04532 [Pseudogymnoascus destructans]